MSPTVRAAAAAEPQTEKIPTTDFSVIWAGQTVADHSTYRSRLRSARSAALGIARVLGRLESEFGSLVGN
jgi:hypothetical protein